MSRGRNKRGGEKSGLEKKRRPQEGGRVVWSGWRGMDPKNLGNLGVS